MLDKNKLDELDIEVDRKIFEMQQRQEAETKAYFEGVRKGASLMFSSICAELQKEWQQ